MELSLAHAKTHYGSHFVRARMNAGSGDMLKKLYGAIHAGTLKAEPMDFWMSDLSGDYHDMDDDGIAWIHVIINGGYDFRVGVTDAELFLDRLLDFDPLDGTAPIMDLDHYWFEFVAPLKKLLGIVN